MKKLQHDSNNIDTSVYQFVSILIDKSAKLAEVHLHFQLLKPLVPPTSRMIHKMSLSIALFMKSNNINCRSIRLQSAKIFASSTHETKIINRTSIIT